MQRGTEANNSRYIPTKRPHTESSRKYSHESGKILQSQLDYRIPIMGEEIV
jgi:hypothetical protein